MMLTSIIVLYFLVLMIISFLSGYLKINNEDFILFASLWPLVFGWLFLQAIALIFYMIGEKLKGK